jgi:hypothetical protein
VDLTVILTDEQVEAIALRVADLLADRLASERVPKLLTVAQAAELAGVSAKTIRNWISAGRLSRHGAPRAPRVARGELPGPRPATGDRRSHVAFQVPGKATGERGDVRTAGGGGSRRLSATRTGRYPAFWPAG